MNSIKVFWFTIVIFIFLVASLSAESVSSRKCVEYKRTCSKLTPLNLEGERALYKEFPYMASIGYKLYKKGLEKTINIQSENELRIDWLCSGALISESFVLTTASCLSRDPYQPKYIRMGDLSIVPTENNSQAHQFDIIQTFAHPSYRIRFLYDDIGLIRINGNIEFTDYIRPACLANSQTNIGDRVLVTGWGSTVLQGAPESNLQKIPLNLISYDKCHNINSIEYINQALYLGVVDEKQICVGTEAGQRDLCAGFASAPLVNTIDRTFCTHELIGLRSIRAACGSGNPSVFIRVSAYLNWIEDIVWLSGNGTSAVPTTTRRPIVSPLANRLFVKKCAEYYNTSNCSLPVAPRIFDGIEASGKEFPHMAHVGYDKENKIVWLCGGTLISERFVLTAAHCLTPDGNRAKYVLLGELDHSTDNDDARPTLFDIAEHIKHSEYTSKLKYNDIALFRLQTNVIFNDYIRPACLPEFSAIGSLAIATGWGRTEILPQSRHLLKVELSLITHGNCSAIYKDRRIPKGIVDDTQFCAGVNNNREDTCQGDSGGPLQILHYNFSCMYTIIGITSFGFPACGNRAPAVYTRVFPYLDWIESVVWLNKI